MPIPVNVLYNTILADGVRFKKMEKVYSYRPSFLDDARNLLSRMDKRKPPIVVHTQKVISPAMKGEGNLPNTEYRFWIGAACPTSRYAVCRGCGKTCYELAQRNDHMESTKCTKLILKAYSFLHAIKNHPCLVCGKEYAKMSWGVALCSDNCKRSYMFSMVHGRPAKLMTIMLALKRKEDEIAKANAKFCDKERPGETSFP